MDIKLGLLMLIAIDMGGFNCTYSPALRQPKFYLLLQLWLPKYKLRSIKQVQVYTPALKL